MAYPYLDLTCYLLIYSFLGWVVEVVFISIRDKRLCDRGFFDLPFCLSYGVIMDLLLLVLPSMEHYYLAQYVAALVISAVVTFFSGGMAKRISHTQLWDYQENSLFAGSKRWVLLAMVQALAFYGAYLLLHPMLLVLVDLVPALVRLIVCIAVGVLLVVDAAIVLVALRRGPAPEEEPRQAIGDKNWLGQRLYRGVWRRLNKAYPDLERVEDVRGRYVFAQGICLDKLIWVFTITAFLGDLIETVFCRFSAGVWMSRSSLIYGDLSVVWGFGAVILTVVLRRSAQKEDRVVFLSGMLIGGVYEYLCSVLTEAFFGTTFWDYSDMPFNFGGRTNLLFCIFWGLLAVLWIKVLYPRMSALIERVPPVAGKIATWIVVALLVLDALISVMAMLRYVERAADPAVVNSIDQFLDWAYPNSVIERVWPNIRIS